MVSDMLEVGRIVRAHGLRGEVLVDLISDRTERLAAGAVLATSRGDLTVEASRAHSGRWIVQFAGIGDRTAAEAWHGVALMAEPIDDPDALFVHTLVGCQVIDADDADRGTVVAMVANPASDLLELDTGALVPLTFVVDGPTEGIVRVETPPGLFELFE